MVQENVETLKIVDDEEIQHLDAEATQQPGGEMPVTLEEQAQQVAIEQGYFRWINSIGHFCSLRFVAEARRTGAFPGMA